VVLVPSQGLRPAGGAVEVVEKYEIGRPGVTLQHVDVLDLLRLPGAPADVAAARAALAGVTRLEVRGGAIERSQLSAALLCLRGLRAVSLLACEWDGGQRPAGQPGSDAVAALAWCPRLESLEWDVRAQDPRGAYGSGAR
jgi:hypothetical protein